MEVEHDAESLSQSSDRGNNALDSESQPSSAPQSPIHSEDGSDPAICSDQEDEINNNSEGNAVVDSQSDMDSGNEENDERNAEENVGSPRSESGSEGEEDAVQNEEDIENNKTLGSPRSEPEDEGSPRSESGDEGKQTVDKEEHIEDSIEKVGSPESESGSEGEETVDKEENIEDDTEKVGSPRKFESGSEDEETVDREENLEHDTEKVGSPMSVSGSEGEEAAQNEEDNKSVASPRSEAGDEVPEISIESDDDNESVSHRNDEGPVEEEQDDSSDEDEDDKDLESSNQKKSRRDSDVSDSEKQDVGDVIANIFGLSDEEEEFEGFDQKDIDDVRRKRESFLKSNKILSGSEDSDREKSGDEGAKSDTEDKGDKDESFYRDEDAKEGAEATAEDQDAVNDSGQVLPASDDSDDENRKNHDLSMSDFDIMMMKKKEESSRRRKRKDVDIINDSDDLIAEIISQMRQAADEDRLLNKQKKTATKKLKILNLVLSQMKKQDLKIPFLDQGILNVMADWMAPLPDRSLPNLQIREGMIKQLVEFPAIDQSLLKASGVGRALMYLYKHPKETKENKERAGKLIKQWARPIFNVTTDYHSLTKEEREQRDFDHIPKKQKLQDEATDDPENRNDIDKAMIESDSRGLRPGDKGWIGRARVPAPSTRDYVVRPKWNVEMEFGRGSGKKPMNRFERHMRTLQEKKRNSKGQRAVTISIEGRKMAI